MKSFIFLILFANFLNVAFAQILPVRTLTLEQVVQMSRDHSIASKRASTILNNRYWQYKNFRSNYMPRLVLGGTLPDFNRAIIPITQPDGFDIFRRRSQASSFLDLGISQNIGLTGGEIFMSSQLQRIDIFGDRGGTSFLANPLLVGFRQPIFQFNSLLWDLKIEPIRYNESKRQYLQDMEEVSMIAAELYFNLLLAQINLEIANQNLTSTDTLYQISSGRYNLGKIAENDLLQMELAVMNSRNNVAQGLLDVQLGRLRLKNFLNLQELLDIKLTEPSHIPDFKIDLGVALDQAKKNRQEILEFDRMLLEAERDVARAKGETRFNANLFAAYGLTQSAAVIENAYVSPLEQQSLRVGFQVPVLDWGRAKSNVKIAQANKELTELSIQQARQNFEQEIILLATQTTMHREKLKTAIQADTIAQKRYDISMQRYLIGKIGILDINVALEERVQARRAYVATLRDFWITYYDLRRKTLYDFEQEVEINY
jgi:outer membrane protein